MTRLNWDHGRLAGKPVASPAAKAGNAMVTIMCRRPGCRAKIGVHLDKAKRQEFQCPCCGWKPGGKT